MKTINDRLTAIIEGMYKGNVTKFARATGIPQPTLNNIISGRLNKPSADNLEKIANTINKLNMHWLITGEGEMFKNEKEATGNQSISDVMSRDSFNNEIARLEAIIKSKDEIIEALNQTIESQKESLKLFKVMTDKILSLRDRRSKKE